MADGLVKISLVAHEETRTSSMMKSGYQVLATVYN